MEIKSISIIGLGLIGGSLAKAFRQQYRDLEIFAIDDSANSLQLAEQEGIISKGFTDCSPEILSSGIIFICTPVDMVLKFIDRLKGRVKSDCIITDVSSTKSEVFSYIERLEEPPIFVGGHPMAGTEKSGYPNSFAHLFENAYYVLTPTKSSTESAILTLGNLLKGIGALPITVPAHQHDVVTGCISHVPHIVASALVLLAKNTEDGNGLIKRLAAGGFKDITRIASSSPSLWEGIVLSNRDVVVDLLDDFKEILAQTARDIQAADKEGLHRFFEEGKLFRDSFSATATGLLPRNFELLADVTDEPGTIGKIATLLGNNGINIKNIQVTNSREFEQGCLSITLSDQINTDRAYEVLTANEYRVFRRE